MRVNAPRTSDRRQKARRPGIAAVKIGGGVLAAAVILNAILFGWFHGHTYPRTILGTQAVGNMTFAAVEQAAAQRQGLPASLTFTDGVSRLQVPVASLQLGSDGSRTHASLLRGRSWLPLVAIFQRHAIALPVTVAENKLQQNALLGGAFRQAPVDASVTLKDGRFSALASKDGHDLTMSALPAALLAALDNGQQTVRVPTTRIAPKITYAQMQRQAAQLQASLSTPITYTVSASRQTPAAADIANWYAPSGNTYAIDDFTLRTYIAAAGVKMGVRSSNLTAAVAQTKQALASHQAVSLALTPFAQTKTYHYCVQTRGAAATSEAVALKAKLLSTYADLRGWSLDGQVQFVYADGGCDFTVWLASSDQMSSFGAICDNYWNCEVNNNVVVNLDRWEQATPSWTQAKGANDISEYRDMLINHETGHMLGFGHTGCPGAGQPAPVMMQESISLQGCVFNAWPVQNELDALRAKLDF
ncbi:MAG TPA: DUF3152 domain-containing protein [Candidatus Saccharimonadales bacterium]